MAISWVLKPQHRNRVKFQRFMPWWHAERRRELAEKKEREAAEEKRRIEEEQKRIAEEEERQRVEEEKRLVALEEEMKRLEKERLKAEEKRLKDMNRKRLLEQHMKSEEQRASEVSRRRAENERRRKEEEKYRIEAKQVAEELRKKMADEKRLLELEIARLEEEKVKLESGKVNENENGNEDVNVIGDSKIYLVVENKVAEEVGNSLENRSIDVKAENVAIEERVKGSDVVIAEKKGTQIQQENVNVETAKVTIKEHHNSKCALTKSSTDQELSISESTADKFTSVVTETKESSAKIVDNLDVIRDNEGDKLDLPGDMNDKTVVVDINAEIKTINENPVSVSTNMITDDCKDNLKAKVLDNTDSSILVVPESNNIADTAEVFVDCVDKFIVNEDKEVVDMCNVIAQKREETVAKAGSETLENAKTNQSLVNKTILEDKTVKDVPKKESQMAEKEGENNKTVKINNTKTVKPALKKIQYIQNQFSPINVVKSNANKLSSQNVDKNTKNVNYAKGLSAIAVNDNLNIEKHN